MGTRVNFTDIPDQKEFDVLPTGNYTVEIANIQERKAGENSQNQGARILRWEFEVVNSEQYNGRKVWDNQICIETALWKIKALIEALEFNTETLTFDEEDQNFYYTDDDGDEQPLDFEEFVGKTLDIKVGIRPARTDPKSGRTYDKQNRVNTFYVHEASDADLLTE